MKRAGVILLTTSIACWIIWNLSSFLINFEDVPLLSNMMQAMFCAPDETFQHENASYTTRSAGSGYRSVYVCAKDGLERIVDTPLPLIILVCLVIIGIAMIARGEALSTQKTRAKRDNMDMSSSGNDIKPKN